MPFMTVLLLLGLPLSTGMLIVAALEWAQRRRERGPAPADRTAARRSAVP